MFHYWALFAALALPALVATAVLGFVGTSEVHLSVGLVSAIAVVGLHTLVIVFMIVTGRVLREAMASRPLPPTFLAELNEFFASKPAYPAAVFAALAVVAAGVLGYGAPALGASPWVHVAAGLFATLFNGWAAVVELRALRANQSLLDRAADVLDGIDRERAERGEAFAEPDRVPDASHVARAGLILAVSAWMPYLYWVFIEHRGRFARASLHPWIEASALGLLLWLVARKGSRASA